MKLKINPVFRDLLPAKTPEEYAALEAALLSEGCLNPIIYWAETGFILEGHTRFDIVQKHDLNYMTKRLSFEHEEQAIQWIVDHQLTRRNLTDEQRRYYLGKLYLAEKAAQGGDRKSTHHGDGLIGDTAEKIAKEKGVGKATVERAGKFAKAVDEAAPEEKAKILAGKAKAPKPPKKKPKNGSEKFREPEFMADWGKMLRWIHKLAAGYGVLTPRGNTKYTDEIVSIEMRLKEFKKEFLDYQKQLAKVPQTEGEK